MELIPGEAIPYPGKADAAALALRRVYGFEVLDVSTSISVRGKRSCYLRALDLDPETEERPLAELEGHPVAPQLAKLLISICAVEPPTHH